ncbi:hypothetical protein JCM21900_005722 [Sporobolomyces salmonicolor]
MSLPSPPNGTNPFSFYLDLLSELTTFVPPDPHGFKTRLFVLFSLCGFLAVASAANFAVHVYSHILSNHFVLGGLTGLVSTAVLLGDAIAIYRAFFVDHDRFKASTIWQFCILPPTYASGWLLSWATYQAYLHVEGGRHRLRLPAWLANSVFVVGGIATVGALTVLVIVGSRASIRQWSAFNNVRDTLSDAATTWEGSAGNEAELAAIEELFAAFADATNDFYRMASSVAIIGAILPVLLVIINSAMLAWVWRATCLDYAQVVHLFVPNHSSLVDALDQVGPAEAYEGRQQELFIICTTTLLVAVGFSGWCAWSITPLRHHEVQSWAQLEAIMTVPVWVYATGLGFAQALHGWVEWRYLSPVRRGGPSGGSGTAPGREAMSANSVRKVQRGDRRDVVESLPSAAYIDHLSRHCAADGIGARIESIRVTVQVVQMVTMAEVDNKDSEGEEGDMVEKKGGGI